MTYLIKIGGSLIPEYVPAIYNVLKEIRKEHSGKIFLFPGGGEFADLVRKFRKELSLHDETTHKMALACLDQNAYLLADICKCACVRSLEEIKKVRRFPAVIAPYRIITERVPFPGYNLNIDILSSDSSAIYVAYVLKAKMIIATDVDGVYAKDPRLTKRKPKLLRAISSAILRGMKRGGPLDETFPDLIDRYNTEVWVVNGKHPSILAELITNRCVIIGTLIKPAVSHV